MTASVSNIAWPATQDAEAEALLHEHAVPAIELAPTRYWPDPATAPESEARAMSDALRERGFAVSAFQAVLFGRPDLQVFGPDGGSACGNYLAAICRLAGWMGAGVVVMGAPKNRLRGNLPPDKAMAAATGFFQKLGEAAAAAGTTVCLEPNPAGYGADFLLDVPETARLVRAVEHPHIALNFDMGEQAIHRADTGALLREYASLIGHFHVSEPMLEPFDPTRPAHREAASVLGEIGYTGAVSLEMRTPAGGLPVVRAALAGMMKSYQL